MWFLACVCGVGRGNHVGLHSLSLGGLERFQEPPWTTQLLVQVLYVHSMGIGIDIENLA